MDRYNVRQIFHRFFFVQTGLVYAIGIENYTFEAQATHLHLHYTNYANDFVSANISNDNNSSNDDFYLRVFTFWFDRESIIPGNFGFAISVCKL